MADGNPVIQGQPGWAANSTATSSQLACTGANANGLYLFSGNGSGDGLYVVASDTGAGVRSYSYGSDGVVATSVGRGQGGAGVRGISGAVDGAGVFGNSIRYVGVWGQGPIGVVGQNTGEFGIGVEGDASGQGSIGVFGMCRAEGGIGVYATAPAPSSAALQVNGRAVFSASGTLVVPAGSTSAVQAGVVLSGAAFVLATVQQDVAGVSVRSAVPDPVAGTVTVHLTATSGTDVTVGWMVVN